MTPTGQQVDFLTALTDTDRHLALVARAGCGKTSTILLGVDALVAKYKSSVSIIVCAFNKAIAVEVADKLKKNGHNDWKVARASTIHALGYGLLKFRYKLTDKEIDDKKVRKLVRNYAAKFEDQILQGEIVPGTPNFADQYKTQIEKLVIVAKQAGVGFFADANISDRHVWGALADHFDINDFENTNELDRVISLAQQVYQDSLNITTSVDFDDMILFPLIKNLTVKFGFDVIFLDEAQDLSRSRQALAKKFLKAKGRMIVVGDDRQAIYGFSGADANALDNLTASLDAVKLPLSVTWRCPKAVVREAQKYVSDIEAAPSAKEGSVLALDALPADLKVGDAILCRNTAPLVSIAYRLIREGKACKVEGRSFGDGLVQLVNRWKVTTIDAFLNRLETYRDREVQKARAKDNDAKVEEVNDRCDTLVEICKAVTAKGGTSLQAVRDFISDLFADGETNCILLATYHRSKGREWQRVYLWEHSTRCPSKAARQEWQKQQEANLAYVAITRSQDVLAYVDEQKKVEDR